MSWLGLGLRQTLPRTKYNLSKSARRGTFTKRKIPKCRPRPNTSYFISCFSEKKWCSFICFLPSTMTSLRPYLHRQKRFPPLSISFSIFHFISMFYSAKAFFAVVSFACPTTPTLSMINLSSLSHNDVGCGCLSLTDTKPKRVPHANLQ